MLVELRDAVVASLSANIPELKDVQPHGGRFTLDDLKRYSLKAPAARVAFVGLRPSQLNSAVALGVVPAQLWSFVGLRPSQLNSAGQLVGPVQFMIALITKGASADRDGLRLAERVADWVQFSTWGLSNIEAAQVTGVENLYNTEVDSSGVCLLAVSFSQRIAFGTNRAIEDMTADGFLDGLDDFPGTVRVSNANNLTEFEL